MKGEFSKIQGMVDLWLNSGKEFIFLACVSIFPGVNKRQAAFEILVVALQSSDDFPMTTFPRIRL